MDSELFAVAVLMDLPPILSKQKPPARLDAAKKLEKTGVTVPIGEACVPRRAGRSPLIPRRPVDVYQ
jgi:hypothetical protein